jgi:hypothetical protein
MIMIMMMMTTIMTMTVIYEAVFADCFHHSPSSSVSH